MDNIGFGFYRYKKNLKCNAYGKDSSITTWPKETQRKNYKKLNDTNETNNGLNKDSAQNKISKF